MKNKILTLCVVLLSIAAGLRIQAQEQDAGTEITFVKINKTDGGVLLYGLPSVPEITFSGDKLLITASDVDNLEIPRSEVAHISFEKVRQSALDSASHGDNDFSYCFDGTEITMAAHRLTHVELFDTEGHLLIAVDAHDGNAYVSLSSLSSGIYIVVPNCHPAIKVVKK